ncbi:hypothetical protein [Pelagicoccus sp. SDUM812003]|uniref:hypothetical protein n=1 Tax=Pelagicoccus sp. SDUM812003 TaxID=3041267 RepID=UPI00281070D1|nr:hypothetical protein [Pelagicoccus sp. SDUM812003]MDQ8202860.1 hypothetical protein [Pelagicoccus sp. SDUM812003]
MNPAHEPKPDPIQITPWKKGMLLIVMLLFGATLFEYYTGGIEERAGWLWPMLFVPLILYLLGIVYGDVPARYYDLKTLKPFPVPFARQFDRCVLSLIVLFTGLLLNLVLLTTGLLMGAGALLTIFYALYMALMLAELPNSLRIFRFIQHVNTMQYVSAIHPETFKKAVAYYSPEQDALSGAERESHLKSLYDDLVEEAKKLVVEASPLSEKQQIALNLAVRSGEAIRRSRVAAAEQSNDRLKANLNLIEALKHHAGLQVPEDIEELQLQLARAVKSA